MRRPVDKRLAQTLELVVNSNYREFIGLVAERRKSTPEKINEVAQGRVWTGAQAKERGLVDALGGIDVAIKSAARRANLGDSYRLEYVEPEPRGIDRYLSLFFGRIAAAVRSGLGLDGWLGPGATCGAVKRDLELLFGARENPLARHLVLFLQLSIDRARLLKRFLKGLRPAIPAHFRSLAERESVRGRGFLR